uniref:Putative secreted protein n=1 Tax=Panstrongylus lignarius TaxID=156445 RepID=A0A224Y0Y4_9HEMI
MDWLTFCGFLLTTGCVSKPIRTIVSFAFWALINIDTIKIHLQHCDSGVSRVFNMPELCMSGINICNWYYSTYKPLVRSMTIQIFSKKSKKRKVGRPGGPWKVNVSLVLLA